MFKYAEENNGVGVVIPTDQNSDGVEIVDKMDEGCGMTLFVYIFSVTLFESSICRSVYSYCFTGSVTYV